MYKGLLIDKTILDKDPHFAYGCNYCHKGDPSAQDRKIAHQKMLKRPSGDPEICAGCHPDIAKAYKTSLHYTTAGLRTGVIGRISEAEIKIFDEKVFEQSCRSCHASCGDCHVKGPTISGISIGLINGHRFVKRDEGKTCAFCHGGRVYPEFTGEYGAAMADVHYEKGMVCMDCHRKTEFHGDGKAYKSRYERIDRPACTNCHKPGEESARAQEAHQTHKGRLGCSSCHFSGAYRNCYDCHLGRGATSEPDLFLGLNPMDRKTITTLRVIPTARDTFQSVGIKMEKYDALPNYWQTIVHNIRKSTERTRSCDVCHVDRQEFLTKETLIKGGSKANEELIFVPKEIKK